MIIIIIIRYLLILISIFSISFFTSLIIIIHTTPVVLSYLDVHDNIRKKNWTAVISIHIICIPVACDYLYVQSTVRAWSINDLLYGKRTPFSCGTKPVIPSGHIINGSTLIARSHHLTRAGVFGSILSLLKVLEDVARLQTVLITVVL